MKYIALTIGPIIETLSLGRKTAEIWAASYLFSSFMKSVIDDIRKLDVAFIIPHVEESLFKGKDNGIGLFHDRFILRTKSVTLQQIHDIVQRHKNDLAKMIAKSIKKDEQKVQAYLGQYLQTYLIEAEEDFANPILDISRILDSVELHTPFVESDEDYMRLFLNRNTILHSNMAKNAFEGKVSFPSIPEIASKALGKTSTKEDEDFYEELQKDEAFKQSYKYIAIVHADGDNLRTYIKNQNDPSAISQRLFDFDKKAVAEIEKYGATPIFAGGDDLLFFAPVLTKNETIFDLLDRLNELFRQTLQSNNTTLSFGLSITYYKYPLYEALENSRYALFQKAKNYPNQENPTKNAIHISARKHSGQAFEVTVSKEEASYQSFRALLRDVLVDNLELPHAIQHKLESYKPLFLNTPPERLEATFENIFNEEIHKEKFEKGLKEVQKLMIDTGIDTEGLQKLFSLLSIIKLLRSDR